MNKGISFYFGFASTPEQRAKMISEAGFDCVITTADERFEHQNGTIEEQVELFKKYNLKLIDTVPFRIPRSNIDCVKL